MDSNLRYLAELYSIEPDLECANSKREVSKETVVSLLAAMGVQVRSWEECETRIRECLTKRARRGLSPTLTYHEGHQNLITDLTIPASDPWQRLDWEITEEGGKKHAGVFNRQHLPLDHQFYIWEECWHRFKLFFPVRLPLGYHQLKITGWQQAAEPRTSRIIVAPRACYLPKDLQEGWRHWGVRAQLYSLKSARNWGIGDFGDLEELQTISESLGASILCLGPLHALDPREVRGQNPYFPTSRSALNMLFVDIAAAGAGSEALAAFTARASFKRKIDSLRAASTTDYRSLLNLKIAALEALYEEFKGKKSPEAERFEAFRKQRRDIFLFALFETLREYFEQLRVIGWGWRHWPKEYHSPDNPVVQAFAEKHHDRITFYQFVQWLAHEQLDRVKRENRLGFGLCFDIAAGARASSVESWANQNVLADKALLGIPPAPEIPEGRNTRLCCWNPHALQESFFEPLIQLLSASMAGAGAIRLDLRGLSSRVYWVPEGMTADKGAMIRYPLRDIQAVIALESHRNKCMIINASCTEDPTGEIDGQCILQEEVHLPRGREEELRQSWDYPIAAAVTASAYDSPPVRGFWQGADIAVKQELQLINQLEAEEEQSRRLRAKEALVRSLQKEGVIHLRKKNAVQAREVNLGIHRLLARSPALLHLAALEDMLEQEFQVFMPGSFEERLNWSLRLPVALEEIEGQASVRSIAAAIKAEGRR